MVLALWDAMYNESNTFRNWSLRSVQDNALIKEGIKACN
jgi:hypothetical protein